MSEDALSPPIEDGTGYRLRRRDLGFLGITDADMRRWRAKRAPLGMSDLQYRGFRRDLAAALAMDGVPVDAVDIRIKGSAAEVFSGHHKTMPVTRDELVDLFREQRRRPPVDWEIAEIERRLRTEWISDNDYPGRRPFDALYRLTVSNEPSDYDLQLSSDLIVSRASSVLEALGQRATQLRTIHVSYDFVRKDLVEEALPHLYLFTLRATDQLRRHVSVAVFPSEGPTDRSRDSTEVSAHFRDQDWLVDVEVRERITESP